MKRKGLNDVLSNDRAVARAAQGKGKLQQDNLFDFGSGKSNLPSAGSYGSYKRCYNSHPPLKLPGTDLVIYGGSCSTPAVSDADIYVGLDSSVNLKGILLPWSTQKLVYFNIRDMDAPEDPEAFKRLIDWIKEQVVAGKKVHVGCIGGHGRTGTVLAALVSLFGEPDAIAYVRKHYCQKAVESGTQVKFLGKHFGITAATGYKSSSSYGESGYGKSGYSSRSSQKVREYEPMRGPNIWAV